jgi:hypothetical protein
VVEDNGIGKSRRTLVAEAHATQSQKLQVGVVPHLIWYVITIIQIKQNILYEEWHTNKYTPVQKRKEESHQGEGGSNMYITTIRTIMRETKKKKSETKSPCTARLQGPG